MDENGDDFLVPLRKQNVVLEQRKRIQDVFEVKLKFGIVVRDPSGVWVTVTGYERNRKDAKDYVKSLCNPEETMVIEYPVELDEIVRSPQVHRGLENTSHAAILFPGNSEAHVLGSQLAVVMAASALEDLINQYKESTAGEEEQGRIASNLSSNSVKLTEALNNQMSIYGDLDYTCDEKMPDVVKRVILGWLVDENQDPNDGGKGERKTDDYDSDLTEDSAGSSKIEKLSVTYSKDEMQTQIAKPSKVPDDIKQKLRDQRYGDYVDLKKPGIVHDLIDLTADNPELPLYPLQTPLKYRGGDVADGVTVAPPVSRKTYREDDDKYDEVVAVAKSKGYTTVEINEVIADFGCHLGCDEFIEALKARRSERKRAESPSDILHNMATVGIGAPTEFVPISPSSKQIVNRGQRPPVRKVHQSGSDIQSDSVKSLARTKSSHNQGIGKSLLGIDSSGVRPSSSIELNIQNKRPKVSDLTDDWVVVQPKARIEKPGIDAKIPLSREEDMKRSLQIGEIPLKTDAIRVDLQSERSTFATKPSANEWSIVKPKISESKKHGREVHALAKNSGDAAATFSRSPSPKRMSLEEDRSGHVTAVEKSPDTLARNFDLSPSVHDARSTASNRPRKLRYVVIDGSNVAMTHGKSKAFSCRGIALCVDYFLKRGHREITAFVPQYRRKAPSATNNITDQHILDELHDRNFVTFTPSRRLEQKRKNIVCYDDRFIIRLAVETDGIIVSNDNYRDLMDESRQFREKIENGLLMYSFVGDLFMPPDDPLGRNGPNLDDFMSKLDPRQRPVPMPRRSAHNPRKTNTQTFTSQSLNPPPPVMYPHLLPKGQPQVYSRAAGHPYNRLPVQGSVAPYSYTAPHMGHSQKLIPQANPTYMHQAPRQPQPPPPPQATSGGQRKKKKVPTATLR